MNITLDQQVITEWCPECKRKFTVVRGSVFDDGTPFGLYLIALHGHSPDGRLGHLAIAVLESDQSPPLAAAITVTAMPDQFCFSLVDWDGSPWRSEAYLGGMLNPGEVRASPLRGTFFHIAEHVTEDLPEVRDYFG